MISQRPGSVGVESLGQFFDGTPRSPTLDEGYTSFCRSPPYQRHAHKQQGHYFRPTAPNQVFGFRAQWCQPDDCPHGCPTTKTHVHSGKHGTAHRPQMDYPLSQDLARAATRHALSDSGTFENSSGRRQQRGSRDMPCTRKHRLRRSPTPGDLSPRTHSSVPGCASGANRHCDF